ncbi:methylase [Arthrobacter sp. MYb211]|uniref:class I SAM-dependent methyltransferase n=1 Tax=unclassified Arthrobacter TaxID=235627 RepID=UPI000CFC04F1|nr:MULTISPECIES: class I SAM-dependent methyltransferase [unclassified Arthrobacter]PRA11283.1 methylase [Arthrobacter sp. MYb221]PRC07543.1 methylase [Arthrobacter sp. MYb211]
MANELGDFLPAPNQGADPEVYEIENSALDRTGVLFARLCSLAPWAGKVLLDLGCGSGYWLPKYLTEHGTVLGVEPDLRLLDAARARSSRVQVLHGSAEHLPLADSSVAVVHARFAYFFPSANYDCTAGLREVLRVLRPGGSLLVIDNDHQHGEFASLLRQSPWASDQGEDDYIRRWWAAQGAQRHEVMSSWEFDSTEDLAKVLGLEFPADLAQQWIAQHPLATELSYGYVLYHVRKGGAEPSG